MGTLMLITIISLAVAFASVTYAVILHRCNKSNNDKQDAGSEKQEDAGIKVQERELDDEITRKVNDWMWHVLSVPYDNSITLDSIADGTGIQRAVLADYLQRSPYLTFKSWISAIRVNHVKEMLGSTQLTLSEIAYRCGYADLPSMSKAFKRQYKMSPSKYRKAFGADLSMPLTNDEKM